MSFPSIRFSDVQKDLIEDLYLAGADKAHIEVKVQGKVMANRVATLVQKGVLDAIVTNDAQIRYKLTALGIKEAYKAFNVYRQPSN